MSDHVIIGKSKLPNGVLHAIAEYGGVIRFDGTQFSVKVSRQNDYLRFKLVATGIETQMPKGSMIFKAKPKEKKPRKLATVNKSTDVIM